MARHRPARRRIKIHYSYTVDQAARTVGVGKATVRRWIKAGLPVIDNRKPALIRGADLLQFLNARAKPKQPCPPGQCYCVKCRTARPPAMDMAEFVQLTPTNGNLRGLCPTCGTIMHRRTSLQQLDQIRVSLDVSIVERF
jgi:excisionase family DNA binding protein